MVNKHAYGVFEIKKGIIFRKSAYLQWGTATKSIGAVLLLNPGEAKPSDTKILREGIIQQHQINVDQTMKQVIKLVEKVYGMSELSGRVHIYNLFSIRNTKNKDAISCFEQLAESNVIDPLEVIPTKEELQKHPWICCSWGINSEKRYKHLQKIKSVWTNDISLRPLPFLRELSMESYLVENENILKLDESDFSDISIIDVELSLRLAPKN
ncbi:hypothetical protein ACDX78_20995 [Virgibacillus oceani]